MSYYTDTQYVFKNELQQLVDKNVYLIHCAGGLPGPHLEIGCSIGNLVALDSEKIEGVDIDEEALAIAKGRKLNCRFFNVVEEQFDPDCKYNVIYMRHVIEHFSNPLSVLKKIKAALLPGGRLVIETPDYLIARNRKKANFWDDYTHQRPFTANTLKRISQDAGFDLVIADHKPNLSYLAKLGLKYNIVSYEVLRKIHLKLGLHTGDLLFVLSPKI